MHLAILPTLISFLTLSSSVLAGGNCKCQDPSGTGPQWNDLTEQICKTQKWETITWYGQVIHCPSEYKTSHHQVSRILRNLFLSAYLISLIMCVGGIILRLQSIILMLTST